MFQVAAALVFTVGICTAFPTDHDIFNPLGPWHRHKPPCGLPPFINQLPIDGQEKLREIWKNYKEGMECDNEHQQTREYIHLLPDGLKHIIFAGRCGPSFLRNVSKTIRDEFRSVWFNHRLSEQEKELRLKKLAYSLLSGESLALFHKWDEELQIRKAEFAEKVANLSPDARDSLEKWKTLKFKEYEFLANLPRDILDELKTLCKHHRFFSKFTGQQKRVNNSGFFTVEPPKPAAEIGFAYNPITADITGSEASEESIDREFSLFMDVGAETFLDIESECSAYY